MNAPKLRFKGFNDQWQPRLFDELYEFKNGLNKEKEAFGSGTPIINYMDVNKNTFIDIHDIKGKVNLTDSEIERFLVKNNDLFFTRTSETSEEIGLTCSYIGENTNLVFSGFVLKASPKIQEIDSTFYSYYLRTFSKRKIIIKHSSITTRALTSGTLLSSMPINYTAIAEQKKIASFFKKIDFKIQLQLEKINLLKEQKKGYLKEIFSRKIRFKGYSDEWKRMLVNDVARLINGRAYKKEELLSTGKYTVLRVGNFFTNDNWYYSNLELDEDKYANNGDLLYAWSASFGPKIWTGDKVIYHYHIWKVKINEKVITQDFLYHWFNYDANRILSQKNGTTMVHVTKNSMENREILLPTLNEQKAIGDFLNKLDKTINLHEEKLKTLQQQKQAFKQEMFI